jgi:hypothetical protein
MATAAGAQQAFPVVDGALDAAQAASAKANQAAMDALVVDLKQRLAKAAAVSCSEQLYSHVRTALLYCRCMIICDMYPHHHY